MSTRNTEFRRLAAIMFTDMVGYSALSQRDEGLALDLLEEHRVIVRNLLPAFTGRQVKTTGDGFLLEFNSALAAVQCAIAIQQALAERNAACPPERRVEMRIGIHVGDVVTTEGDIHGDGVNIAARIEPLAAAGGICITEDVQRQVHNKIPQQLIKAAAAQLKNIQSPVQVYHVQLTENAQASAPRAKVEAAQSSADKSVAVLPFANMSSDQENEYLSDGITEDLITALSKIAGLRVPARTSSFAFKSKNEDIRVIGDKLSVATVLEGSVRKSGKRLRITAQLISVLDGFHLWSERFDREMEDVFEIQDEITRAIVNALKVRFVRESEEPLVKAPTASMEAYSLYLKGREFWYQRGIGLKKALHYFELALLEDPEYSLAYAGLADTLLSLTFYGYAPGQLTAPKIRAAMERALDLDPTSSEAMHSKGCLLSWYDWDTPAAETAFKHAIELKPNSALAHIFYGAHLCGQGRVDESIAQCAKGVDLDPLSPFSHTFMAWMCCWGGRYENVPEHIQRALKLAPNYVLAHWILGQKFAVQGLLEEAIASFQRAAEISQNAPWVLSHLAHAYAKAGQKEKALNLLEELKDPTLQPFVRHIYLAQIYTGLHETEQVFKELHAAYEQHDVWLRWLWQHYQFIELHDDPRFLELAKRVGIPKPAREPRPYV